MSYDEPVLDSYQRRIARAARDVADVPDAELETALYPWWLEAVHAVFLRHGCGCLSGRQQACFLAQPRERQIATLQGSELAFPVAISIVREARKRHTGVPA